MPIIEKPEDDLTITLASLILAKHADKPATAECLLDDGYDKDTPRTVDDEVVLRVKGTFKPKDAYEQAGTAGAIKLETVARMLNAAGVTSQHMLGLIEQAYLGELPELDEGAAARVAAFKARLRTRLPKRKVKASVTLSGEHAVEVVSVRSMAEVREEQAAELRRIEAAEAKAKARAAVDDLFGAGQATG